MGPRHNAANSKVTWCAILIATGAIVAIVHFILFIIFLIVVRSGASTIEAKADAMINEAIPAMLEREVGKFMGQIMEPGPEHRLTQEAQNVLMVWGLTLLQASSSSMPPAIADEAGNTPCPSRSQAQCDRAFATCNAFDVCRRVRSRTACADFVTEGNSMCSALDCRTFDPSALQTCEWVQQACGARLGCVFNSQACVGYETSLARACDVLRSRD